jgi:hypothetical protein
MMRDKNWGVCILAGAIIGTLIVAGFVFIGKPHPPELEVLGTDPHDTIFSELVDDPGLVAFNLESRAVRGQSFVVNLTGLEKNRITADEADIAGLAFLIRNLNVTNPRFRKIWEEVLLGPIPIWRLPYSVNNSSTTIEVNALTGAVIQWTAPLNLLPSTPYYENGSEITSEIAEQSIFKFLKLNNYSIPLDAVYNGTRQWSISPLLGANVEHSYCGIFYHVIDGIPLGLNPGTPFPREGIIVQVDAITGLVVAFKYVWWIVGSIIANWRLDRLNAERIALDEFDNATVLDSIFTVTVIGDHFGWDGEPHLRLVWIISVLYPYLQNILVDVGTGEIVERWLYN